MFILFKNNFLKLISILALSSVGFLSSGSAMADDQCIKNQSGAVIKVEWHELVTNNKVKSDTLAFGEKSCKSARANAVITCSGCVFAEAAAKGSIVLAGGIIYGTCIGVTGGTCLLGGAVLPELVAAGVESVPDAFNGKLVVFPYKSQNIAVKGNAFGLKLD